MASSSGSMTPSKDERKPNHLGRVKSKEMAFSKILQSLKTHDIFIPPNPAATNVEVAGVEPPIPDVTAGTDHRTSKLCNRCVSMFQNLDQFMEDTYYDPYGQSLMELKRAVLEEECALLSVLEFRSEQPQISYSRIRQPSRSFSYPGSVQEQGSTPRSYIHRNVIVRH
jgi:hypothetical protein